MEQYYARKGYGPPELKGSGSIYESPPKRWFWAVADAVGTPERHDPAYRRVPLLTILAYADRNAAERKSEQELIKAAFKAGNPMGALLGKRSR